MSLGLDKEVRYAYRGGFTWLNDRFKEKEIGEGMVFDVNSLYPAQMYSRLLPYGEPIVFEGKYVWDEDYPLHIQHIRCEFELKEGYILTGWNVMVLSGRLTDCQTHIIRSYLAWDNGT